jgi:hypothetical protein
VVPGCSGTFPWRLICWWRPDGIDGSGFVDTAAHRATLPAAYNRYRFVDADPAYAADTEELHALLFPLFVLSFLLDDWLATSAFFGAQVVVVSSASSKSALGTGHLLAGRGTVTVIGLTSDRHVDHVTGLGVYDAVTSYDVVDLLADDPAVFLDFLRSRGRPAPRPRPVRRSTS